MERDKKGLMKELNSLIKKNKAEGKDTKRKIKAADRKYKQFKKKEEKLLKPFEDMRTPEGYARIKKSAKIKMVMSDVLLIGASVLVLASVGLTISGLVKAIDSNHQEDAAIDLFKNSAVFKEFEEDFKDQNQIYLDSGLYNLATESEKAFYDKKSSMEMAEKFGDEETQALLKTAGETDRKGDVLAICGSGIMVGGFVLFAVSKGQDTRAKKQEAICCAFKRAEADEEITLI